MINHPIHPDNSEAIKKDAEVELKKVVKTHMGGTGQENIKPKDIGFDKKGNAYVRFIQVVHGLEVEGAALMSLINGETGNIDYVTGEFVEEDPTIVNVNFEELESFMDPDGLFVAALKEAHFENTEGNGKFLGDVQKVSVVECNMIFAIPY